ncbi:MAG TPA: tRNA (adenosine(37)-N6)-threonylcarbamoyltransferase complex ATPase subunit type 1 TsaE [Candidatus Paceibacterota bacterium]|nr:tRNA (adenosine(37)-N6)-threonylcarbamoyltransferase complex ATPase subunit type 1 TsaE [Candidatus Paceibacterota bacterium]
MRAEQTIQSLEQLKVEAASLVAELTPLPDSATLITLSGILGAGKTAFTKAVAEELGLTDMVTSPTFVLEKIYALPAGSAFKKLIHIDAYRLGSGEEMAPLGFDEAMREPSNLILLEWPERVHEALPLPAIRIAIAALQDGSRRFSYEKIL